MAILMLILIVICYWNPAPIFGPYIRSRCFLQLFEMNDKKKKCYWYTIFIIRAHRI